MASKKRKYRQTFASTMGGPLIAFDDPLFQTITPAEPVHAGEDRGRTGEPDELEVDVAPPADGDVRDQAAEPA